MLNKAVRSRVAQGSAVVTVLVVVALLAFASPAAGDIKPPSCGGQSCEVEVETPGRDGWDGADAADPGTAGGGGSDSGSGSASSQSPYVSCESKQVDTDNDSHPLAGERPSDGHVLIIETCLTESGSTVQSAEWLELGAEGQVRIAPEVLAQRAVDRLRLPTLSIAASPATQQLVRLPTWLWVEESSWQIQSATASVPGLTVTAQARPVAATWSMGDGATVSCTGPGTPWPGSNASQAAAPNSDTPWLAGDDPEAASPDCGHVYQRASGASPFRVNATVTWEITWFGGGASGSEPDMQTTATTSWPVIESQALLERS